MCKREVPPQGSTSLFLSSGSIFLWSIRGKLLDIGVCCLCVLLFVVGEYITVGVQRCFYIGVAKALLQHLRWHSALNAAGGVCMPQAVQGYNAGYGRIQHIVFFQDTLKL